MTTEPTDDDLARIAEEQWAALRKSYPFQQFLKIHGPMNWTRWIRRLDPTARERVKELGGETALRSGLDIPAAGWKKLKSFIRGHPGLLRRVETEYRLQLMSMMRAAIFGKDLKAPDLKAAEWKALYRRLQTLLAAFAKGDASLVDVEVAEPGHKIDLRNPDVLTPRLLEELQQALQGWTNDWYVVLALQFDDVDPELDPGMLVVWADHVDEALDRDQLRRILGPRFRL